MTFSPSSRSRRGRSPGAAPLNTNNAAGKVHGRRIPADFYRRPADSCDGQGRNNGEGVGHGSYRLDRPDLALTT